MRRNLAPSGVTPVNNAALAAGAASASEAAQAAQAAAEAALAAAQAAADGAALVVAAIAGIDTTLHDADGFALETRTGSGDDKTILVVEERGSVRELLEQLVDLNRQQIELLTTAFARR